MKIMMTITEQEYFEDTERFVSMIYKIENDDTEIGRVQIGVWYDEDGDVDTAYVADIVIYEGYRNRGYGTKVLNILAAEYGYIYLCAENEDAERLYQRIGEEIESCERVPECLMGNWEEWGNMYRI